MKITGRIGYEKQGALEFLGRSIYRSRDGESSLHLSASCECMVSHANFDSEDNSFPKLVVGFLFSIRNRLVCNENSLNNFVHMESTLDSVTHKHIPFLKSKQVTQI